MIGKNQWRYIHTSVVMLIIILACFTILCSSRNCLFNIHAESVDRLIACCARTAVDTDRQAGRQPHKPTQGDAHFPQEIIAGVIVFTLMRSLDWMPHILVRVPLPSRYYCWSNSIHIHAITRLNATHFWWGSHFPQDIIAGVIVFTLMQYH